MLIINTPGKGFIYFIIVLLLAGGVQGCGKKEEEGTTNSNPKPTGVSISGTIEIAPGSSVDSDVNDPNAAYRDNDSIANAQTIPNPTTLGGYVNAANTGPAGHSFEGGDTDDYYLVQLFANQTVSINVADYTANSDPVNRLALYLLDQDGTPLQHTLGQQQTEFLSINSDGIYYLRVAVISGASNYIITIGLGNQQATASNSALVADDDFVPGEVIVEFKQNQLQANGSAATVLARKATSLGLVHKAGSPGRPVLMSLDESNGIANTVAALGIKSLPTVKNELLQRKLATIEVVKALRKRPDIVSARLNYIRKISALPNDQFYQYQWDYPQINLPQAWDVTTGNSNVIVAVIDTGVLLNHPDLKGQLVAGYDFIRDAQNARDGDGIDDNPDDVGDDPNGNSSFHGTHVSGTIAAASNNTNGVAGVAWDAKIMPLRALGRFGGTDYDIEQAVRFAARLDNDSGTLPERKADVINLSLGGPSNTTVPSQAFRLAREAGVIVVAAAGNDASNGLNYPASLDGVVSVSATTISNTLASYSNYGNTVDLAAPGGDFADKNGDGFADGILSTVGSDASGTIQFGYAFYQGTSMASPHVAGVLALMKSVNSSLTPNQFDQLLEAGDITDDLGKTGRDNQFGYGQIDAYKAVNAALNLVETPPEPLPPLAEVQPTALNFGPVTVSMEFTVSNAGEGDLQVTQISNNANGWLTVSEISVDANGLGRYIAQVNRQVLPQETQAYSASITVNTNSNTLSIPVLMQVFVENVDDDAGFQYVLLKDSVTQQTVQKIPATRSNGHYEFQFDNVLPGSYNISAGTDSDNDGLTCEVAEACGTYLMPTYIVPITINEQSGGVAGVNFQTSFDNMINSGAGGLPLIKLQQLLF